MEGVGKVRKLSLAMALALGMLPIGAHALGLGDIHLKSALNQHLAADIELLSVSGSDVPYIEVSLASADDHARAGVERPFMLSQLKFKPDLTPDGQAVIRVSSPDPIREPFLNFLIEVNWPKGKMVREYTVLLDPPVTIARRPPAVRPVTAGSGAPARAADRVQTGDLAAGEYGPTQRNDTLWAIATQVRHEGVSMQQMMMSLLQANPAAFINNNINNLKRGQILRIPGRDEVLAMMSSQEAQQAVRDQTQSWRSGRSTAPVTAKPAAVAATRPVEVKTEPPAPAVEQPEAELKIATVSESLAGNAADTGDSVDSKAVVSQLQAELIVAQEARESALQEGEELRQQVKGLEDQLADLQRLLSLQSEQLAQLQASIAARQEAAKIPEEAASMSAAPSVQPPQTEVAATVSTPPPAEPAVEPPTVTPVSAEPVAKPAQPAAKPPATPARKSEGFLQSLMSGDMTLLGSAIGGVVVLLTLLWVVIARRRSKSPDFQESILINPMDDADSEQLVEPPLEPSSRPTEETSFLSDFAPSDIDALQDDTGEVDPVSEADVYIAYGRYQQAEELIRQAVEKYPDRVELKFKLFEILFATRNAEAFIEFAEQQEAAGLKRKEPATWKKVVTMGAQIAGGHALFGGTGGQVVADDDAYPSSMETALDMDELADLDFDELGRAAEEEDDSGLAFDLDTLDAETSEDATVYRMDPSQGTADRAKEVAEEEFDFDLGLELGLDEEPEEEEGIYLLDEDGTADELEAFDFSAPAPGDTAEQLQETVLGLKNAPTPEFAGGSEDNSFESLGLDLENDQSVVSLDDLDKGADKAVDAAGADESDEDEAGTKLELARAYFDMGDPGDARELLQEVIVEGNADQQQQAQKMLEQIA